MTDNVVEARGVTKKYGAFTAIDNVSFDVPTGTILGVIGANGAGKTSLLNSILGLARYQGELTVLGHNPYTERDKLMADVCFISDVATLPRWMKVNQIIDHVDAIHPRFVRAKCLDYLKRTTIPLDKKIRALSKGMVTQLHLSLVMAIDAKLLVLDEPTLGLDIIFRKEFYANLIGEYFDEQRTIIITTHQVEEIENLLTDAMFIREGKVVLHSSMEDLRSSYVELVTNAEMAEEARKLGPIHERNVLGRTAFVFENVAREKLAPLGDEAPLSLADLFVAKMTGATS